MAIIIKNDKLRKGLVSAAEGNTSALAARIAHVVVRRSKPSAQAAWNAANAAASAAKAKAEATARHERRCELLAKARAAKAAKAAKMVNLAKLADRLIECAERRALIGLGGASVAPVASSNLVADACKAFNQATAAAKAVIAREATEALMAQSAREDEAALVRAAKRAALAATTRTKDAVLGDATAFVKAKMGMEELLLSAIGAVKHPGVWAEYVGGDIAEFFLAQNGRTRWGQKDGRAYRTDAMVEAAKAIPFLWTAVRQAAFNRMAARSVMLGQGDFSAEFAALRGMHESLVVLRASAASLRNIAFDADFEEAVEKIDLLDIGADRDEVVEFEDEDEDGFEKDDLVFVEGDEDDLADDEAEFDRWAVGAFIDDGAKTATTGGMFVGCSLPKAFANFMGNQKALRFALTRVASEHMEGLELPALAKKLTVARLKQQLEWANAAMVKAKATKGQGREAAITAAEERIAQAKEKMAKFSKNYISTTPGARFWALNRVLVETSQHLISLLNDQGFVLNKLEKVEAKTSTERQAGRLDPALEFSHGYAGAQPQLARFGFGTVQIPEAALGAEEACGIVRAKMMGEIEDLNDVITPLIVAHKQWEPVWKALGYRGAVLKWAGRDAAYTVDEFLVMIQDAAEAKANATAAWIAAQQTKGTNPRKEAEVTAFATKAVKGVKGV